MNEDIKIEGQDEIEKALLEFKAKSALEALTPVKKKNKYDEFPKMVGLVMKVSGGAIKEERQANYVLLGVAALFFALMFFFFSRGGSKTKPLPLDLQNIDQRQFVR